MISKISTTSCSRQCRHAIRQFFLGLQCLWATFCWTWGKPAVRWQRWRKKRLMTWGDYELHAVFSWVKDLAPLVIHVHLDKCLGRDKLPATNCSNLWIQSSRTQGMHEVLSGLLCFLLYNMVLGYGLKTRPLVGSLGQGAWVHQNSLLSMGQFLETDEFYRNQFETKTSCGALDPQNETRTTGIGGPEKKKMRKR